MSFPFNSEHEPQHLTQSVAPVCYHRRPSTSSIDRRVSGGLYHTGRAYRAVERMPPQLAQKLCDCLLDVGRPTFCVYIINRTRTQSVVLRKQVDSNHGMDAYSAGLEPATSVCPILAPPPALCAEARKRPPAESRACIRMHDRAACAHEACTS